MGILIASASASVFYLGKLCVLLSVKEECSLDNSVCGCF